MYYKMGVSNNFQGNVVIRGTYHSGKTFIMYLLAVEEFHTLKQGDPCTCTSRDFWIYGLKKQENSEITVA